MIVPAGNNKLDWSPKETKLQKVASDGQEGQDIEVDALYEAAKGVVEAAKECEKCEKCECDPCECKDKDKDKEVKEAMFDDQDKAVVLDVEEVTEAPCESSPCEEVGEVIEEVSDESSQSVSEAVAEVEAKADQAEAVVEEVVLALEQIEEAVEGVKAVCGKDDEVEEGVEVEVEVEDVPGEEEVDDDEVIVEGDEAAMDKSASAEEFCKYAKLSPQNRKKLNDYWSNMLGYPKDFVNLMTKDYEK